MCIDVPGELRDEEVAVGLVSPEGRQLAHAARPWPPPRWPGPIITPVRPLIDAWLSEDPPLTPAQIWERLVDDHDVDITYGTVAQYTARHRPRLLRSHSP